jgi:TfoX/Sxy family transcriptional regulator of competence genes
MASSKEYRDYVLEQLSEVPDVACRSMMGEFLLYSNGVLFGGIYDDRLLVKKVPENAQFNMSEEIPYDGAKPMYLVEDVDDKEKTAEIIAVTVNGLSKA